MCTDAVGGGSAVALPATPPASDAGAAAAPASTTPTMSGAESTQVASALGGGTGALPANLLAGLQQVVQALTELIASLQASTTRGGGPPTPGEETSPPAQVDQSTAQGSGAAQTGQTTTAQPTQATTQTRSRYTPETVHLTQFRNSRYNPNGPGRSNDCVPASAVMALRLAGLDIKDHEGEVTGAIDRARVLGSGVNDNSGMDETQLAKMLERSGAQTALSKDPAKVLQWAREGSPIVLFGNPADAWGTRFSHAKVSKFDGNHAVTLSFDQATGRYLVNDPLSRIGVIETNVAELAAYMRGHTSGGSGTRVINPG